MDILVTFKRKRGSTVTDNAASTPAVDALAQETGSKCAYSVGFFTSCESIQILKKSLSINCDVCKMFSELTVFTAVF